MVIPVEMTSAIMIAVPKRRPISMMNLNFGLMGNITHYEESRKEFFSIVIELTKLLNLSSENKESNYFDSSFSKRRKFNRNPTNEVEHEKKLVK
jgi:hypothetical protein